MLGHRLARLLTASGLVALLSLPDLAFGAAWQEIHETADDVRFEVGKDGVATVQHHLRYRIVAGRYKTFDIVGIDPRGEIAPEAVFTADKGGGETPARVEPVAGSPGTIRIFVDEPKGLGRGAYAVDVAYRLDLVAAKILSRDGAMWKLSWAAPPAPEGQDGARVIFDLPASPTEPRLAATAESTTTLQTVRRGAERDELELVRAHVPRGDAALWVARVDPKAFPFATSPELRPPPIAEVAPGVGLGTNASRSLVAAGLAVIAGALAALLRAKQRAVEAAAAIRHARVRRLVPLPAAVAPFVFGIVTALSFAMLLWWSPVGGACLVALGMAIAAFRAPLPIVRPRGPGVWKPLERPESVLAPTRSFLPSDPFDIATARARIVVLAIVATVTAAAWLLGPYVPQIAIALPLSAATLVPVFVTGTRAQLAPSPSELASRILRPTRDALASALDLAHVDLVPMGRLVGAAGEPDEVRLACAPRDRTPGLRTIELALATVPGGQGAVPEVFVRFDDASAASARIAALAPGAPIVPGRSPEERVMRVRPDEPTPRGTAALLARLVLALEGRRDSDRGAADVPRPRKVSWRGRERRARTFASSPSVAAL